MSFANAINEAIALDAADPLSSFRDEFVIAEPGLIYLDGNSLGRLPKRTVELMRTVVDDQWGGRLVRGWGERWIDLPGRVGAKIAQLIGAEEDEVLVCDSTSVNFYKLAMAALGHQKGRTRILTDTSNFPSDVYLLQGCAKQTGHFLDMVEPDCLLDALTEDTALLTLSHTSFKSGAVYPMADLTRRADEAGAIVLWDLSHSVGAVPVELNRCGADMAVGCTYKYLSGGPGAPAFLYVRRELQDGLTSPIWGWFGQKNAFDFTLDYLPAKGLQRFMAGTPPILSMAAIECGVDLILAAGIERLRQKSILQIEFLIKLWEAILEPLGVTLNSPRESSQRGSHLSFGHPEAFRIDQALIYEMNVIPDFRTPDNIRFGVNPISTTFKELAQAVVRMHQVIVELRYEHYPGEPSGVT